MSFTKEMVLEQLKKGAWVVNVLDEADYEALHIKDSINIPLKGKADLSQTKLWAWVDDPLVRTLFTQLGANGVPLGVPDVLPSLQTGLIDTISAAVTTPWPPRPWMRICSTRCPPADLRRDENRAAE